jgi:hypothetical protein
MAIRVAPFVQECPSDWKGNPLMDDAQHQNIEDAISKFPLGTVIRLRRGEALREHPRFWN